MTNAPSFSYQGNLPSMLPVTDAARVKFALLLPLLLLLLMGTSALAADPTETAKVCVACHGEKGEGGLAARLIGGPPKATLDGGKGNDVIVGGPGRDYIIGGGGRDRAAADRDGDRASRRDGEPRAGQVSPCATTPSAGEICKDMAQPTRLAPA